jgi:hypothetical protein
MNNIFPRQITGNPIPHDGVMYSEFQSDFGPFFFKNNPITSWIRPFLLKLIFIYSVNEYPCFSVIT